MKNIYAKKAEDIQFWEKKKAFQKNLSSNFQICLADLYSGSAFHKIDKSLGPMRYDDINVHQKDQYKALHYKC